MNRNRKFINLSFVLLLLGILPLSTIARPFVLVLSQDDLNLNPTADPTAESDPTESDFDDFIDSEAKPDYELDPGSWSPLFEPGSPNSSPYFNISRNGDEREDDSNYEAIYYKGVGKMVNAASSGDERAMAEAASEIETAAEVAGHSHAQSVMGLLYGMGIMKERSKAKSFLNHYFAAGGGNMQSKMVLAYTYYRQDVSKLYNFLV